MGGRVKREADREVERGQIHIRNVNELNSFVSDNFPGIEPILISEEEDYLHKESIEQEFHHAKAIKGSSKLHQFSSVPGCTDRIIVKRFSNDKETRYAQVSNLSL